MSNSRNGKKLRKKDICNLREAILSMVQEANQRALPERRVSDKAAITVANRDLQKTKNASVAKREFSALRAVGSFISLATINKATEASLQNSDLLAIGHPFSTKAHSMTTASLRNERAKWIAADEHIDTSIRSLVIKAHGYEENSMERAHAFARLASLGPAFLPITASIDLNTATSAYTEFVFGLGLGGNSDMARRLRARMQRRDRAGRFAFMGGGFSFSLKTLEGLFSKVSGRVVGASGNKDSIDVEVRNHPYLPDGIYSMPSSKGTAVKAILDDKAISGLKQTDVNIPADDVFVSISDLTPMMAPTGWTTEVSSTEGGKAVSWLHKSEDGYSVYDNPSDPFGRFQLRREEGNGAIQPFAKVNSWADIQNQAVADQDQYKAYLEKEQINTDANKAFDEAAKSGEGPPRKADAGKAWVKHENGKWYERELGRNYDLPEEDLQKIAKDATGPFRPPADKEFGKWHKTSKGNWKEWDEGSDAGWQYRQDYQKRLNSEYSKLKRLQEAQQAGLFDPKSDKLPVRDIVDPAAGKSVGMQVSEAIISGESIKFNYNGKFDVTFTPKSGYTNQKTGERNIVGLDAKGVQRTYTESKMAPPKSATKTEVKATIPDAPEATIPDAPEAPPVDTTPDVVDLKAAMEGMKLDEGKKFIAGLAAKKQKVRFNYSGSERVVEPIEIWVNGQTGRINLRAMDNGTKKNFSFDKIEKIGAPKRSEAKSTDIVNLDGLQGAELTAAIDKAIAEKQPLKFTYHEKERLVRPLEVWTNPKTGKVNLRAVEAEADTDKNFTLEKIGKPVDEKIKQINADDIINMPQDQLDDVVDALWPAAAPSQQEATLPAGRRVIDASSSTAVSRVEYDPATKELFIQFKSSKDGKGGGVYKYSDVAPEFVDRLESGSIGKMIPELKKNNSSEKLDEFPAGTPDGAGTGGPGKPPTDGPTLMPGDDGTPDDAATRNLPTEQDYMDDPAFAEDADAASFFDEQMFDSLFDTPDGSYKLNVFEAYRPVGRTNEDSPDFTDDPDVLATKFSVEELGKALAQAVLPITNDQATGYGNLPFESGDEPVKAEALYEALGAARMTPNIVLAGLYDSMLDPERGLTNVERITDVSRNDTSRDSGIDDPFTAEILPVSDRSAEIDAAIALNEKIGSYKYASNGVQQMRTHSENNPKMLDIAKDLMQRQDDDVPFDTINLIDLLDKYLPWASSSDANERDAFRGLWGMMMSLDGGSSIESDSRFEGFRREILSSFERRSGSPTLAQDDYDEFVLQYGGFPEFVASKKAIVDGQDDLSSETSAAAFFRLVKASSRPNTVPLWRSIGVAEGSSEFEKYTVPGSRFDMDPRSFTSQSLETGTFGDVAYSPSDKNIERVLFRLDPGDGDTISAESISWFPDENENFASGSFQVIEVTRQKSQLKGRPDDYVVHIRKVDSANQIGEQSALPAPGQFVEVTQHGDISGWTQVGNQAGSNPGGFYDDPAGNHYYIKKARSQSHADNEALASAFYKELGVPAAEVGFGEKDGVLHLVTPLIDGAKPDFDEKVYGGDAEYVKKVQDNFAVDAWLANYDVVGMVYDNVVSDASGEPVRVDPGGSLMWRAQGKPKTWFGDTVDELDSMRDPDVNDQAANVFGTMSDDQIKASAQKIANLTPDRIEEIIDSVVTSPDDAALLKERLLNRRQYIMDRFGFEEPADVLGEPQSIASEMGIASKDLQAGDVTVGDSFVIERVFTDGDTKKGKVSVQGYFPGHESQVKQWNENTVIMATRGGQLPAKGDAPALHRPVAPTKPQPAAFTGSIADELSGAQSWDEVRTILRGKTIVFFDYETTGFPDKKTGDKSSNQPVQLGAVKVVDGQIVDRFNLFMNPEEPLGGWSRDNLKGADGTPLTDEQLATAMDKGEAHQQFIDWAGQDVILAAHNAPFDMGVLNETLGKKGLEYTPSGGVIDTLKLAQTVIASKKSASHHVNKDQIKVGDPNGPDTHRLGDLATHFGVELGDGWHTADADSEATSNVLNSLIDHAAGVDGADASLRGVLDAGDSYQRDMAEFDLQSVQFKDELANYEIQKAIAAAWNCRGGTVASIAALIAAIDDPDCNVPSIDDLINAATPGGTDFVDPEGLHTGDSSTGDAYTLGAEEVPEMDGVEPPFVPPLSEPDDKFPPTPQQQAIVEAMFSGGDIVIRAAAGAGKTSTLHILARRIQKYKPKERIVYIAFNASVAAEARDKMPSNVEVRTADSISYNWVKLNEPKLFKKKGSKDTIYGNKEIAKHIGAPSMPGTNSAGDPVTLPPSETVRELRKAVYAFTISADKQIGPQHFDTETMAQEDITPAIVEAAQRWWDDVMSEKGLLSFDFNHMKKIWALSNPNLNDASGGLNTPATIIFMDEAQDINPVLGRVVAAQTVQKVYVGDENQAIYQFMGAEDELQKVTVQHDLPLTKSFRFGPVIAQNANRFLRFKERFLGARKTFAVEGAGKDPGEIVPRGSMVDADAVLVRSNSGAFREVRTELANGRVVGVTKGFKQDLDSFVVAVDWLQADPATRGLRPMRVPEELRAFTKWEDVVNEAAKEGDSDLGRKTRLLVDDVEELGVEELKSMAKRVKVVKGAGDKKDIDTGALPDLPTDLSAGVEGDVGRGITFSVEEDAIVLRGKTFDVKDQIKTANGGPAKYDGDRKAWIIPAKTEASRKTGLEKLQTILTPSADTTQGPQQVDVVISTVHQAKGLEWPNVRAGNDFFGPRKPKGASEDADWIMPSEVELNLAYVAGTRAESKFDPGSLEWIDKWVPANDPEILGLADAPNAPEANAPETPAAPEVNVPEANAPEAPTAASEDTSSAPTTSPDVVNEVAETVDTIESVGEATQGTDDPFGPGGQAPSAEQQAKDLTDSFNELSDYADSITDPEGDNNLKTAAKGKVKKAQKELKQLQKDLEDGSITQAEAATRLQQMIDEFPDSDSNTDEALDMWAYRQSMIDLQSVLTGERYMRPTGKGLPPRDAVDSKGRPVGFSKDGKFLRPGTRVRDKWGFSGVVDSYNENDWINVNVRYDIDPRDPDKVKKGKWGPGVARVSKNSRTLIVLESGDREPWIDNGSVPENKKPKQLEEQTRIHLDMLAKRGETAWDGSEKDRQQPGGDLPKAEAPQGATEAPKDFKLTVSGIKDKEKNQKKSSTDKALITQYKGVLDRDSDIGKAVTKYVDTSAGINITTSELSSSDDERKKEHIDFILSKGQSEIDATLEETNIANLLTDAIDNAPKLADETILYRSIKSEQGAHILGLEIGEEFVSNGFSSTSIDKNKAMFIFNAMDENKALMVIAAPPGTKGLYIDARDEKDKMRELEFLLQRGTRFRVVGRDKTKGPYGEVDRVYVEIVSQETPNVIDTSSLTGTEPTAPKAKAPEAISAEPSVELAAAADDAGVSLDAYFDESFDKDDVEQATNSFSLKKTSHGEAADAVIYRKGADGFEVLMISREYGPFRGAMALPGGFRDGKESFPDTADREMSEEVGITAADALKRTDLGTVLDSPDWDPRFVKGMSVGAVAYMVDGDVKITAGDDATGAAWVSVQDLANGKYPIAFGHATWLAEAFDSNPRYAMKFAVLVKASKERNARVIAKINEVRSGLKEPVFEQYGPDAPDWTPENANRWKGSRLTLGDDGVTTATGVSFDDVEKLKNGSLKPPVLPFFVPMGSEDAKDGDGYYFAKSGKRYWGRWGAEGVLLRKQDSDGTVSYLLGKRADWISSGGGKWAYPGGAHVSPYNAERGGATGRAEILEELGVELQHPLVRGKETTALTYENPVEPDWMYRTVIIDASDDNVAQVRINDNETSDVGWFTADQIKVMNSEGMLHPSLDNNIEEILKLSEKTPVQKPVRDWSGLDIEKMDTLPSGLASEKGVSTLDEYFEAEEAFYSLIALGRAYDAGQLAAMITQSLESNKDKKSMRDQWEKDHSMSASLEDQLTGYIDSSDRIGNSIMGRWFETVDSDSIDAMQLQVEAGYEGYAGISKVIERTGRPKVVPEVKQNFSESNFAEVPSLMAAVQAVVDKKHASGSQEVAVSAMVDSGDIEDLEVRASTVVDVNGERKLRLRYTLTSWAGAAFGSRVSKDPDYRKDKVKMPNSSVNSNKDIVIEGGKDVWQFDEGVSYVWDSEDLGTVDNQKRPFTITLVQANDDPDQEELYLSTSARAPNAIHNQVVIDLPLDATDAEITEALGLGGVRSPRPATQKDVEIAVENRLLSLFGSMTDATQNTESQGKRQRMLDKITADWGVSPSDIAVSVSSTGHIEYRMPKDVAIEVEKATGVGYMNHNIFTAAYVKAYEKQHQNEPGYIDYESMTPRQKADVIAEGLMKLIEAGGLMSTVSRYQEGRQFTGMSSNEDMGTGGADYVFFTPSDEISSTALTGTPFREQDAVITFKARDLLERIDIYANRDDKYGERRSSQDIISSIGVYTHEFMTKHGASLDDAQYLSVSRLVRESLLKKLSQQNISKIGGRDVKEVIIENGSIRQNERLQFEAADPGNALTFGNWFDEIGAEPIDFNEYVATLEAASKSLQNVGPNQSSYGILTMYYPAPEGSVVVAAKHQPGTSMLKDDDKLIVRHPDGTYWRYSAIYTNDYEWGASPQVLNNYGLAEVRTELELESDFPPLGGRYMPLGVQKYPKELQQISAIESIKKGVADKTMSKATAIVKLMELSGMPITLKSRAAVIATLAEIKDVKDPVTSAGQSLEDIPANLSSFTELMKTNSYIASPAILEMTSGENIGSTRVVYSIRKEAVSNGQGGKQIAVMAMTVLGGMYFPLDLKTGLIFDTEKGIGIFSSRGIEYKIRGLSPSEQHKLL